MKSVGISVIMPCYNHGAFVREAVASVMAMARGDVELIVVDDGSTDERTREEVKKLASEGIRVICQANKGLAGARNAAISVAKGTYIYPLDADDRIRSGWMDRALQILESDPNIGVVYGDAECFGSLAGRWVVGPFNPDRLLEENYIHASALYRRVIWEQNGGYDGTMPVQGLEDWDMWVGALERGWGFEYLPEVFFEYRQAEGSMITRTRGYAEAVEEFVAKKHGPLYRQAWLRRGNEQQSARATARRLGELLKTRVRQKLGIRDREQVLGKPSGANGNR